NAYFNLTKLGASITAYFPSFYGPMNDGINGRDDSDRVLVVWALDSQKATEASTGNLKAPDLEMLTRSGAEVALKVDTNDRPVEMDASGDTILVGVPRDIVEIRRNDPDLAHLWRLATRDILSGALNDGYEVVAMTRSGYYVLERIK
ncbi:MAG TPA: GNAT family N-acetyltransferase, partial [Actinomycetota bacterium]|nr:GNAT family N-acetyltransferase [Actinomycetota bacterium]